jgi:tRNA threonylcarbamoyl adenosine modification protein YjeE
VSAADAQTHESSSVAQTEAIAAGLAGTLRGGECIALYGDLGAGKTQFVRGLVRGLGGEARRVSSPTFVLLNVYESELPARRRLTVYHLDAYRVAGAEDFEAIGFGELLEQRDAIVVVEWAERVAGLLPGGGDDDDGKLIEVRIETLGKRRRRIEVRRRGRASGARDGERGDKG